MISIPRVRARVTEHVVLERTCRSCRKRWTPEPDWSAFVVGRRRMGISVQSEVSVLREECRLPFGVIQRYLKWRYGLPLSMGELVALTRGVAERRPRGLRPVARRDTSQSGGVRGRDGLAPRRPQRLSLELQRSHGCVAFYTGQAAAGQWCRRCWGKSSAGCWSATSTAPTTFTRVCISDVGPTCCGTSTN